MPSNDNGTRRGVFITPTEKAQAIRRIKRDLAAWRERQQKPSRLGLLTSERTKIGGE